MAPKSTGRNSEALDEVISSHQGSAKALVDALIEKADTKEEFWLIPTAECRSPTSSASPSSTKTHCRAATPR